MFLSLELREGICASLSEVDSAACDCCRSNHRGSIWIWIALVHTAVAASRSFIARVSVDLGRLELFQQDLVGAAVILSLGLVFWVQGNFKAGMEEQGVRAFRILCALLQELIV